jgi:glycosyltransferase involved in cell wall biosynthesis
VETSNKELEMVKKSVPLRLESLKSGSSPRNHSTLQSLPEASIRLSIITQFYPPDFAATGQLLEELATHLKDQGLQVQVFTGQPGYAFSHASAPAIEQSERLCVRRSRSGRLLPSRIRGKALNGLFFVLRSVLHLLKPKNRGDVLLLTTAPPFSLILGYLAHLWFRTPYVCLLYDLYPDVAVELNVVAKGHWITRLWDSVNRTIWKSSKQIIVLSSTMRDRVIAKCPEVADRITIIHSWADPDRIAPMPKEENWFAHKHSLVEPFTVLYSGNMGRCHDMDTILEAMIQLQNEPIQFVFIGNGAKRQAFIDEVARLGLRNCKFLPYQEKSFLPFSLTACDLSLVSVSPGMEGLVAPSKLYSALAAGRPIAAICEPHSYLRELLTDAECGAVFNNGDANSLADFIRCLASDRELTERLGNAGRRYMESNFTPQYIARQYARVFRQVVLGSEALEVEVPVRSPRPSKLIG